MVGGVGGDFSQTLVSGKSYNAFRVGYTKRWIV